MICRKSIFQKKQDIILTSYEKVTFVEDLNTINQDISRLLFLIHKVSVSNMLKV